MNEDDVKVVDDDADDDVVDVTAAGLQNASDGQVKTILKLAMMAGSKKKEAVQLMKNLIGISEEQEKYVLDELARMAKTPKPRNPYKKGRPAGQTNREGHNAGRPSNASKRNAAAAAAAMFGQRTVRQRTDCSSSAAANETAASASIDQQQATEAAQAAAAVKSAEEKKRYDRAIEKIEQYVASVPNGSFTATIAEVDDDDDEGLDLDVDSDDEGGEDEEDGASVEHMAPHNRHEGGKLPC